MLITYLITLETTLAVRVSAEESSTWQQPVAGDLGMQWLTWSASARNSGTGNASTAVIGDPCAYYSNPAGLYGVYNRSLNLYCTRILSDTYLMSLSYAFPVSTGSVIAINYLALETGDIKQTNALAEEVGSFNACQSGLVLTYMHALPTGAVGANLKVINDLIFNHSAYGYGLDIGYIFSYNSNTAFGFMFQNIIAPVLSLNNKEEKYALNLKTGMSHTFYRGIFTVLFDVITESIFNNTVIYGLAGIEARIGKYFDIRCGINHKSISLGFGVGYNDAAVDYAYSVHELLGGMHHVSINWQYSSVFEAKMMELKLQKNEITDDIKKFKIEKKEYMNDLNTQNTELKLRQKILTELSRAKLLIEDGKYEEGKAILENALKLEPGNQNIRNLLMQTDERQRLLFIREKTVFAKKQYEIGNYAAVLKETKLVLDIQPDYSEAKLFSALAQAHIFIQAEKYKDAEAALAVVLSINPTEDEALQLLRRLQSVLEYYENIQR
ncbi:MAG: hypothetical protein WC955_10925 [Elusimicrobiota bacterium]